MDITDFLRKIGMLRSGSVAWKGDAAARPVAAGSDDFYGSAGDRRQETTGSDATPAAPAGVNDSLPQTGRPGKVLHSIALAAGVFILAVMAACNYFGGWFWGNALFWIGFTRYTRRAAGNTPYALGRMISLLLFACLVSLLSLTAIPTNKASQSQGPPLDPVRRVELAVDLETELGLEDVRLSVPGNEILEIRTKAPVNITPRAMYSACAYIFAYLEPGMPGTIKTLRLIFTVNDLDAMLIETPRRDVAKWQAGDIPEKEYLDSLNIVNLGVASGQGNTSARKDISAPAPDTFRARAMK